MQHPHRRDGRGVSDNSAQRPVASVTNGSQAVAVFHLCSPTSHVAVPRAQLVVNAYLPGHRIGPPAIMVAAYPNHGHSRLAQIGEGRQHAETRSRDNAAPLEPEVEEISVYEQRTCPVLQLPQKSDEVSFFTLGVGAEVVIGNYVTWGRQRVD
jgi:hypothetical protein